MKTELKVKNIKCGGCVNTIMKAVSQLKGITDVAVDQKNSSISFDYHTLNQYGGVINKLRDLGYPPISDENTLAF